MQREMLITVGTHEVRMAILEDGEVVEVKIEREGDTVGNIYKGTVTSILPGMDSAFVEIGLERHAFLHARDACPEESDARGPGRGRGRGRRVPPIQEVLEMKQEVMVQLVRGPIGSKGARVTTRISLPGRYVVLLPIGASYIGVSKKLENETERQRLKGIGEKARPRGQGLILRTEAEGCEQEDIDEDVAMLKEAWRKMREHFRSRKSPSLIHEDLSLSGRMVRDYYSDDVSRIQIDSKSEYDQVLTAMRAISQEAGKKVKLYRGNTPLFEKHGVEKVLEQALQRRVPLPSGGNLTVDETEAIVAVDVNTGSYTGAKGGRQRDTILKTNLEAAKEIARQLRLRDLGGIIILDFIDMYNDAHKQQVMQTLEDLLKRDRARTRVVHLSPLGLVEMTRKRTGQSLLQAESNVCDHCRGRGRALTPQSLAARVEHALKRHSLEGKHPACRVVVPPYVAYELVGEDAENIESIERDLGLRVYVRADAELAADEFRIDVGTVEEIERVAGVFRHGQMFHVRPAHYEIDDETLLLATANGYTIEIEADEPAAVASDGPVTVELVDVGRSWARGVILK